MQGDLAASVITDVSREQQHPFCSFFVERSFHKVQNQHLILGNNKELKTNSDCVDNDATGCFDRIIVLQGMIAAGRLT